MAWIPRGTRGLLRSLNSRNFRLFFAGQGVSLIGTWVTRVASSWLAYRLTGSALLLGVAGFCGQLPTLVISPVAGVIVDRCDRRRILLVTQSLSMLQSAALGALALARIINFADLIVLQIAQGMINAFDTPARQSLVIEIVDDPAQLPNAIALNSALVNGSRMIGPAIGGLIIAAVGEGWCFMLDAMSYLAVIGSLLAMRCAPAPPHKRAAGAIDELRAGWRYVVAFGRLRSALLLLAIVATTGMPYTVLLPAISSGTLHGGPRTVGFLMTSAGFGALASALYLASRSTALDLEFLMSYAAATLGVGLMAFSLARRVWLSLIILPFVGAGMMVTLTSTNTFIQGILEERFRGRVMAFYTMAFLGTAPIASLIVGIASTLIGPEATIFAGGIACIMSAVWYGAHLRHARPA